MTVRSGLQPTVDKFRRLAMVGTEEEFNGVLYWSDVQLQEVLDDNTVWAGRGLRRLALNRMGVIKGAKRYILDEATASIVGFTNEELYEDISELGAYDPDVGVFDGTDTQAKSVTGKWFDLYSALADFWNRKAEHRVEYVQTKAGQNTIRLQDEYNHCIQMRDHYRAKIIGGSGWS